MNERIIGMAQLEEFVVILRGFSCQMQPSDGWTVRSLEHLVDMKNRVKRFIELWVSVWAGNSHGYQ